MTQFDVFNGDADGICALQQLRLVNPIESTLITGVKRDIDLLKQVQAKPGDHINVLDISLDKNRSALIQVLDQGASVFYCDHHFTGEIPVHQNFTAKIDTTATVCTSLLIDQHLGGQFKAWAITAAFGDNLHDSARQAATGTSLTASQLDQLKELGTLINYNGYGANTSDLHFHPADLYRKLQPYPDPLNFIAQDDAFHALKTGYEEDIGRAQELTPETVNTDIAVYILPAQAWARRVSGVFANDLAQQKPERAHAILTEKADGGYLVSVRAPLATKSGADDLCRQFATGGGRKAAAGINHLPTEDLQLFINRFQQRFGQDNE